VNWIVYCPDCRAEYRAGFVRCADCGVELVEELPPLGPEDLEAQENERPDLAKTRYFLAWLVPMSVYVVLFFGVWFRPLFLRNLSLLVFFASLSVVSNLGGFWMLYQAVRYERRVGRYVLLAFVPFMFVWYSLVHVPLRKEFQGNSEFIR
jgi:hypothetical protein